MMWLVRSDVSSGGGRLEGFGGGKHGSHFGHQILKIEEREKDEVRYVSNSFDLRDCSW